MSISTNTFFCIEKFLACGLVLLGIAFLSSDDLFDIAIITGHAHFALTYIYQSKFGKLKLGKGIFILLCVPICFYLSFYYSAIFTVVVAICFLFHYVFDEFKLLNASPYPVYIPFLLPLIALFSGWITDAYMRTQITYPLIWTSLSISAVFIVWKAKDIIALLNPKNFSPYAYYLMILSLVLLSAEFTGNRPIVKDAFSFIILTHFITWYMALGKKYLEAKREYFYEYLRNIAIVNAVFVGLFLIFVTYGDRENFIYLALFDYRSYFAWTMCHLIVTLRFSDYINITSFIHKKTV